MNSENKIIGGIIGLTVAIIAGIVVLGGKSASPAIEATAVAKGETIHADSHKQGNDSAKVKLVEFGDFQCPACGKAYPILKQVVRDRGSQIQFVWRNYPLSNIHQNADNAARAAEAAGRQNKFFEMHDKLFETQSSWVNSTKVKDIFSGYAKDLGLSVDQFNQDFDISAVVDRIKQDKGDGNALGVDATPTLFLNNSKYDGDVTVSAIEAKIDELLK